ncbi:MAG: NUDIX domain-containing protein, partial [Cyanobacteria bacterium]|nr:NUDIX domain-containing protein [Cyanobacteriota bacterium]
MTGHLTASTLLINTNDHKVLLVYHKFLRLWLPPGGHLDVDEVPVDGALRELREETGIENATIHMWHASSGVPIDIDSHHIPLNDIKNEGEHFHHDFQYLCSSAIDQPDSLAIDDSEVSRTRWVNIALKLPDSSSRPLAGTP